MPLPPSLMKFMHMYIERKDKGVMNVSLAVEKSALVSSSVRSGRGDPSEHGHGGKFSPSFDDRDKLKCEHCGRSKHTKDQC